MSQEITSREICDENENNKDSLENPLKENVLEKGCFICRERSPDCRVCQNILSYHSKQTKANEELTFPGPGIVKRNHIYGNYVVASRTIKKGEVIILERPITIGPYSTPDILPLCLACCKDIGLSSKCSKCKWPVCSLECEQSPLHSENECKYFAKNNLRSKQVLDEYFTVEALRALLLRDRNAKAWKRVMEFEPHLESRRNDYKAKQVTEFIIHFIRNRCGLEEFSPEVIEHVVGVLSVNTFWAYRDLKCYTSCLFDKITLFAHDCDPNTNRKLIFLSKDLNENEERDVTNIALKITAARDIEKEEMITIRYINLDQDLIARREELKETFYFECTCSRCLKELSELETTIEVKTAELCI